MQQHSDVDLVGSNTISIDENGTEFGRKSYLYQNRAIQIGNQYMPAIAHIWMARRNVYDELCGYRDIPYAEDFDFLLRGEIKGFHYANINEYLYSVRHRNGNTTSSVGLIQRKTADYVKRIHRYECRDGKDHFDKEEYRKSIVCSKQEQENYCNAAILLSNAIKHKSNKKDMIVLTIKAAMLSPYLFHYLVDAVKMRIIKRMEMHRLV